MFYCVQSLLIETMLRLLKMLVKIFTANGVAFGLLDFWFPGVFTFACIHSHVSDVLVITVMNDKIKQHFMFRWENYKNNIYIIYYLRFVFCFGISASYEGDIVMFCVFTLSNRSSL